ncbi:MAG: HNH endonuclease family protein [Acidimicrobiaceae bacterium]|nr:HNH endonuclease family protein [Acidimicrobiaceae bacterium]
MPRSALSARHWVAATLVALGIAGAGCTASPTTAPTTTAASTTTVAPTTTVSPTTTTSTTTTTVPPPATTASPPASSGSASAILQTLAIKGRAPLTGYSRDQFGPAWADVDRNGCDTRNDILRRDLTDITFVSGDGCTVLRGTLHDPYTGKTIPFMRGPGTSSLVQIDHVVALADAWQKGAQAWSAGERWAFGNDPLNLLAVEGAINQQKGDGDAATWLPPNRAFRCSYVARQIAVKHKYGLWVTSAEHDAMARVLATCPGQPLPEGWDAPVVPYEGVPTAPQPTITTPPPVTSPPAAPGGGGVPPIAPYTCPPSAPIKGNIGTNGRIFHLPGGQYYERTNPEVCFATPADALAAGFRASLR